MFRDIHIEKEHRFSIGIDQETGKYYLSIPVANQMVDYEEYYFIDKQLVESFPSNLEEILVLVSKCRNRENDTALIHKPGRDRGVAS